MIQFFNKIEKTFMSQYNEKQVGTSFSPLDQFPSLYNKMETIIFSNCKHQILRIKNDRSPVNQQYFLVEKRKF